MTARCPFPHGNADAPASPGRRALFQGAAFAGGAALLGGFAGGQAYAESPAPPDAMAPETVDPAHKTQPFYGAHQSGVTNPAPAASLLVAFNVLARDRNELSQLFQILTRRFAFLTKGGLAATDNAAFPPPDSGIMGPEILPNNLTATLAVGASLFDKRFGLGAVMPASLMPMTAFPNDRLDGDWCHGDLMLQFCSNSPEVNLHALRDIIKNTPALLMVRWKQDGFLPESTTRSKGKLTPRNLLGFKDGTANPDSADAALMDKLVWVQPDAGEPAWAVGGTYLAVRIIRMLVEQWDRTPLIDQENIIGRNKDTGAPLGMTEEHAVPDYVADPKGKTTALDAHIRLANPRTAATDANLLLRRGYNYSRGATKAGQLDMGLIFNAFQADLAAGFLAVQTRLNGEPFEEYIKPTGGGYYFVLPGIPDPTRFLGQGLLEAATA